jgi:hypothetical protein
MGELKENNNKMNLKNKNKNKASWFGFFFFWVCCWLGAQGIIFVSVITLGGPGGTGSGLITAQLLFCATRRANSWEIRRRETKEEEEETRCVDDRKTVTNDTPPVYSLYYTHQLCFLAGFDISQDFTIWLFLN